MPINIPGLLVPFHILINPRIVIPGLVVKDIRQLDFSVLRTAGYRGAVFDKDNCLTLPHRDTLVPELHEAWAECREAFGPGNVLVVSNSAGTGADAGGIKAESVSYYLGVPVLRHTSLKPSYSCISAIRTYFSSLPVPIQSDELIFVGDRIFTDVIMANRMKRRRSSYRTPPEKTPRPLGPLAIWTTGVWQKENMVMRWMEETLLETIRRWTLTPENIDCKGSETPLKRFVRREVVVEAPVKQSLTSRLRSMLYKS